MTMILGTKIVLVRKFTYKDTIYPVGATGTVNKSLPTPGWIEVTFNDPLLGKCNIAGNEYILDCKLGRVLYEGDDL